MYIILGIIAALSCILVFIHGSHEETGPAIIVTAIFVLSVCGMVAGIKGWL